MKGFQQRKQLIWKLKLHAETAAIFIQMNKTLKFTTSYIFCIIWCHVKILTKSAQRKSVCPVIWSTFEKRSQTDFYKQWFCAKPFVETVLLFLSNNISAYLRFYACICLIFHFACTVFNYFYPMFFSVSDLYSTACIIGIVSNQNLPCYVCVVAIVFHVLC